MAVTTDGWFNNSVPGTPQTISEGTIYDKDANPKRAIGSRLIRQDGSEFVYCHFGADTTQGLLVAQDISESGVVESDNIVVAPASAVNTNDGTIGAKFIEITLASITADQFAGGYFTITDGTGIGYVYRIKGNTATGDPAAGNFRLQIYEPLQVALDATSDINITGSLYSNLEVATAATDIVIPGVSCSNMDVSEQAYGWVCVKGVWCISVDATDITLGDMVALSADVSGNIYAVNDAGTGGQTVNDEEIVGVALDTPDDNSFCLVKFNLS